MIFDWLLFAQKSGDETKFNLTGKFYPILKIFWLDFPRISLHSKFVIILNYAACEESSILNDNSKKKPLERCSRGLEEIDFHKLIDGFQLNPSIPSARTKSTRMWETSHRLTSTQKNLFSISINHRSVDVVKNYWRGERSKSMATTHFTFVLVVFCYTMRVCWSTWATPYGSETVFFSSVEVRSQSSEMFSCFFHRHERSKFWL